MQPCCQYLSTSSALRINGINLSCPEVMLVLRYFYGFRLKGRYPPQRNEKLSPQRGRKSSSPQGDAHFLAANTMALECKPTSHFLAAFNFSLSSPSVSFSPTHPPSPLSFLSALSAPEWPSPTRSLEQCEWEIACVTKAIKRTHAHIHKHPLNTSMQVKIHKCIANDTT